MRHKLLPPLAISPRGCPKGIQTQPPFEKKNIKKKFKKRGKEEEENGKKIDLCWLGESGHFEKLQSTKVKTYMESKIQELLCGASNFPSLH